MSSPDPLPPISPSLGILRNQVDETKLQADLEDLASRFSAQSGGGLSPELSADLALEIVLNEIVEQACLATGANGAAIVLEREGEMVCRATSGTTAPELGARIDTSSGLSGECVRSGKAQSSGDLANDPRVDSEASKRLGISSAMVMPLVRGSGVVGIFELFSSQPDAFGERDQMTLEALVCRTINNLERAANSAKLKSGPTVIPDQQSTAFPEAASRIPHTPEKQSASRSDFVTIGLAVVVVLCALLVGMMLGRHWIPKRSNARASQRTASGSGIEASEARHLEGSEPVSDAQANNKETVASVPVGGLLVYQDGKEVFRLNPARAGQEKANSPRPNESAEPLQLSPSDAESNLLQRVEPVYPKEALQQQLQGSVILDVHIGKGGLVQDVQVVRGAPLLVAASSDAVKQWKFKPQLVNGHSVEMETVVTFNFRLPSEQ